MRGTAKLNKFTHMCGTVHRTVENKTRGETRLKLFNTMAVPVLLYGVV